MIRQRVQHAWNLRTLSGKQKRYTHINLGLVIPQRLVAPLNMDTTPPHLHQDRSTIDHNDLPSAESLVHQKQIGLRDVVRFADSTHW
jgi:hypothetical protein